MVHGSIECAASSAIGYSWNKTLTGCVSAGISPTPRTTLIMSPPRTTPLLSLLTPPGRRCLIATCVVVTFCLGTSPSHGQVGQGPGANASAAAGAQQNPEAIDPQTLSCSDLKARMQSTGQLPILVGPRGGWPDTFYGPQVPRCQFWQMPLFQYVRTNDGLCGIGYICVDKLSFD